MENMLEDITHISDEETLVLTQRVRRKLLKQVAEGGKLPEDPKSQQVVLTLLKDMDTQVKDKKRLAIDAKGADSAAAIAKMAEAIADRLGGADIYRRQAAGTIPEANDDLLPDYQPVPGEMDTEMSNENYDSFVERFNKENPEKAE